MIEEGPVQHQFLGVGMGPEQVEVRVFLHGLDISRSLGDTPLRPGHRSISVFLPQGTIGRARRRCSPCDNRAAERIQACKIVERDGIEVV